MDGLRHRWVSVAFVFFFIATFLVIGYLHTRSEGIVSEPLKRGTIIESVYGIGTVLSNRSFQIKLGVTGTVDNFYVKEGDTVKQGAPLAKIDKIIHRAPFDGTVTYLPFKAGENVFAQVPVLSLVDLKDRYIVVSLEQQGALQVRAGQKATMSFDTIRQRNYPGVVQSIYSNGNGFLARIDASGLPPSILPGMSADIAIEIRRQEHALAVPVAALINGNTLWVKHGGHGIPKKVEVTVGIIDKSEAEVVSGALEPGDRVIIKSRETS